MLYQALYPTLAAKKTKKQTKTKQNFWKPFLWKQIPFLKFLSMLFANDRPASRYSPYAKLCHFHFLERILLTASWQGFFQLGCEKEPALCLAAPAALLSLVSGGSPSATHSNSGSRKEFVIKAAYTLRGTGKCSGVNSVDIRIQISVDTSLSHLQTESAFPHFSRDKLVPTEVSVCPSPNI